MSVRSASRTSSVVAAALLVAGGIASARAQSLAEVAKKEEDRRKTVAAPAKVYTNKDLSPVPAGSPPPPAAAAKPADEAAKDKPGDADAKGKDPKAPGAADKTIKDQAYWSGRLKAAQDAVLRDQNYADAMQTRINALTTDFVNRDDPAQRAAIEQNRQKSIAELARLTKAIQDDKKAVADIEEEARRAGVPPAWLR